MFHKIKLLADRKTGNHCCWLMAIAIMGLIVALTGCGSSAPSSEFTNLPLYVMYNNSESSGDVTVGDLFNFGFSNPNVEKSWKKNGSESWSIILNDKLTGNEITIVINQKSGKAFLDRILVNNQDMSGMQVINMFYQLTATISEAAKKK
ncbi:hypothetical protein [Halopseudomonas salegens]|uniref:Uncharacterized protein n=1 Tax=Halopseudomonas salegens TaxID=1434072 RepID=A0A1H2FA13_9GAMM|nr:hypothetical protein [Halopseudomonas salegens]SDU04201.1 hypothetical protein SAMN05216210_1404 [Halopseudomonas salegens]